MESVLRIFLKKRPANVVFNNLIVFIVLQFSTQLSSNIFAVSEHAVSVIHSVLGSMLKNFQVMLKFANFSAQIVLRFKKASL
jgi:hypothetical protein